MKGILLCILLCLLVAPSFQYGILRVEEIWSNLDTNKVVIEDVIIGESNLCVDYLHDLSELGVWIEGVTFQDGSINIPGDLTTSSGIKFFRALYTNGGVFMDAGLDNPDVFSFTIEDDTGNTFIAGVVRAQQGIDVEDGKFHTEGISGDTTIGPALIRPNGGIVTEEGDDIVFSADTAGNIFTAGTAYFGDDVYFGTNDQSDRTITRFATELATGGATYFCGQNADAIGGDLYLQPGLGANFNGIIQFGDSSNADLFVGRPTLSNGVNGGTFTIAGQNSLYGDGGDLWLSAGSSFFEDDTDGGGVSTEDDFDGGSIYIAPGIPTGAGLVGKLIVGSTGRNTSGFDLVFGRPPLDFGDGADTFLAGQTTKVGIGGNFYLQAGSVRAGIGAPGDLILSPGDSLNRLQGNVYLGRAVATDLVITRVPVAGAAGVTKLISQSGLAGKGGPLVVSGGDAGGDFGAGGNLWIQPGSSSTGEAGKIIWGRDDDSLEVLRIPTAGFGLDTIFNGQSSNAGAGGDFTLRAGQGHGDGGDLVIESGFADGGGSAAGDILLSAGDSVTSYGGDVYIEAGASNRVPGSVVITAGRSTNTAGGSVVFNAGSGSVNGDILIGVGGNSVQSLGVSVFVRSGILALGAGNAGLTFNSNNINTGIIFWNGVPLIRTPQAAPAPPVIAAVPTTTAIQNIAASLSGLVNAFAPCRGGHNLITLVDQTNNIIC